MHNSGFAENECRSTTFFSPLLHVFLEVTDTKVFDFVTQTVTPLEAPSTGEG
jgi:hypothetical protein